MTAVAGQFVKFDAVATRKVVRLTIEAPIEKADDILRDLGGYPDPANAKWVGIAPLTGVPKENTLKGGALAQRAAMLCDDDDFVTYANQNSKIFTQPAVYLRAVCCVESRAHLDHDQDAARLFLDLQQRFETWRDQQRDAA